MISANSRVSKEKVKYWILSNSDFTDYDLSLNMESFHEVAVALMEIFNHEKGVYTSYITSEFTLFKDWCRGLPTCLHTWNFLFGVRAKYLFADWKEVEVDDLNMDEMQAERRIIYEIYKAIHTEYEKEVNKK